ncbi:Golgi mannosyltransferase complex subunit [Taxawa tesnikishii (nom. ined.)]|nr:Golgi mannosyltransferase complex subunit [Dothideales sp. JES 119]
MAVARSLRRTNPITVVLLGLLIVGFLMFFLSSPENAPISMPGARQFLKSKDAASNALSLPHYLSETVLILTPLARFYQEYWDNLLALSYPHDLISLGFIIPKGREGNAATAQLQERIAKTQASGNSKRFASITILRQDEEPVLQSQSESERHAMAAQKERRAAMSRARNALLFTTLGPTSSWVLCYDKPIIVPNCFQRYYNKDKDGMDVRPYDFNSWVDSPTAQNLASKMGPDEILLEGYAELATYRSLMAYMADHKGDPKQIVQLDGVGGTALLVKAEVHRDGAMFPAFPFYHLIETEGFAKMGKRLGWTSWGLPNYFVYHYNE